MIEPGDRAPEFRLVDQDGDLVSLEALHGTRFVLAFYPQDFSPVCTDQLTLYEPALAEVAAHGAELFGVSVDSAWCHGAFREQLGVTMRLLADFHPKGEVARAFGVYSERHGVSRRALVMVGPDGVVEWTHRPASPLEVPPADLVLEALRERAAQAAPRSAEDRR